MPRLRWTRAPDDGQITIHILMGTVEQERFSLPGWDPDSNQGPPLAIWLMDYYELSEQDRRDKHQGRFEKYVLARREAADDHVNQEDEFEEVYALYPPSRPWMQRLTFH